MAALDGLDLTNFWDHDDYFAEEYTDIPITPQLVSSVEQKLGYKLPQTYIELMRCRNGGAPKKTDYRTSQPTSWAKDHVAVTGIFAIGFNKRCSLCGEHGSQFYVREWGYPPIGVYFADCPSAGHDMVCLDYRACGPQGSPQVVHVDQELDYAITFVARDFETFIRGLEDASSFTV